MKDSKKKEEKKEPTFEEQLSKMIVQATKPLREAYEKEVAEMKESTQKIVSELEDKLRSILAQMAVYVCYNCGKDLISGKDSIYTNFEGKKFCGHPCIDEERGKDENPKT